MAYPIDIIGDIHGQLGALRALGRHLGYAVDDDWSHPACRKLVFVGDLIDRGPHSLEVAQLVQQLCDSGNALCLMGNHELNLVEWRRGRTRPKHSNNRTVADVQARAAAWASILDFFERLPIALELDTLRVVHAVWHPRCVAALEGALREPPARSFADRWQPLIRLHAPYFEGRLRPGVSNERFEDQHDTPLEILLKGYESAAPQPFIDNDGRERDRIRAEWWKPEHEDIPKDRRVIFGHYWNMPPIAGYHHEFVPPHPSGHPELRDWFDANHRRVPADGWVAVPDSVNAVCIDYNGVTRAGARACVGAYRHPEAHVVWATDTVTV